MIVLYLKVEKDLNWRAHIVNDYFGWNASELYSFLLQLIVI